MMSDQERRETSILIVDADMGTRTSLRNTLMGLGYQQICDAQDHATGLTKLAEKTVTHVIFDARSTNISPKDFIAKALKLQASPVYMASSFSPTIDDVFSLLVLGARGYLVKPFNESSLEEAILQATKGEKLSEAILYAESRNTALASLALSALDKVAVIMRQVDRFDTARAELPFRMNALRRAVDVGKTFVDGSIDDLVNAMMDVAISRSNEPATRLGRTRRRRDEKKRARFGSE